MVRRFVNLLGTILGWALFIPLLPIFLWASWAARQGRYRQALCMTRPPALVVRYLAGREHPVSVGFCGFLGYIRLSMGDFAGAELLLLEQVEIRRRVQGEDHPQYATNLNNLAMLYYDIGSYDRAELFLLQALEIRRRLLGEEHPQYAASLWHLATLHASQGRYIDAFEGFLLTSGIHDRLIGQVFGFADERQRLDYLWGVRDKLADFPMGTR